MYISVLFALLPTINKQIIVMECIVSEYEVPCHYKHMF